MDELAWGIARGDPRGCRPRARGSSRNGAPQPERHEQRRHQDVRRRSLTLNFSLSTYARRRRSRIIRRYDVKTPGPGTPVRNSRARTSRSSSSGESSRTDVRSSSSSWRSRRAGSTSARSGPSTRTSAGPRLQGSRSCSTRTSTRSARSPTRSSSSTRSEIVGGSTPERRRSRARLPSWPGDRRVTRAPTLTAVVAVRRGFGRFARRRFRSDGGRPEAHRALAMGISEDRRGRVHGVGRSRQP